MISFSKEIINILKEDHDNSMMVELSVRRPVAIQIHRIHQFESPQTFEGESRAPGYVGTPSESRLWYAWHSLPRGPMSPHQDSETFECVEVFNSRCLV